MRREKVCQSLNIETPHNSYSDILQRLVRRYLFKLERQKEEGKFKILPFCNAQAYNPLHYDNKGILSNWLLANHVNSSCQLRIL